ncbi:MAG TPA: hypothetical protein VE912_17440 [Bacteroidales bacterium]|nr:hypothetical protein [Bacteroidales bacterium]
MLKRSGERAKNSGSKQERKKTNTMNGQVAHIVLKTPWNNTYRQSFYVAAMGLRGRSLGKAGISLQKVEEYKGNSGMNIKVYIYTHYHGITLLSLKTQRRYNINGIHRQLLAASLRNIVQNC